MEGKNEQPPAVWRRRLGTGRDQLVAQVSREPALVQTCRIWVAEFKHVEPPTPPKWWRPMMRPVPASMIGEPEEPPSLSQL